jgi:hypothetical protein
MTASQEYTVLAVYEDNLQPFGTVVEAANAADAIARAAREADSQIVGVQVIEGAHDGLVLA